MVEIARYSEFNASTFNTAMQGLEDAYNAVGNSIGVIANDTLASDTNEITIPVSGTYEWLMLDINLCSVDTTSSQGYCLIEFNDDDRVLYSYNMIIFGSLGATQFSQTGAAFELLVGTTQGGSTQRGMGRFMMIPLDSTVVVFGRDSINTNSDPYSHRLVGQWSGGNSITSIRLTSKYLIGGGPAYAPTPFKAGGTWQLSGARV